MSVTENIIRIRNVTKVFQMGSESIHAVDNVSLNIHKEEVCCLFGIGDQHLLLTFRIRYGYIYQKR